MKTLVIVQAHSEAQATFDRHLPFWEAHRSDIVVLCPRDAIIQTDHYVIATGNRGHHNTAANRRIKDMIRFFLMTEHERLAFFEYDAVCFQPVLPLLKEDGLWSNLFTSDQPQFQGHFFTHPPLIMSRDVAIRLLHQLDKMPDDSELCFWDRMVGYACELAFIPMYHYGERGFARNTIEPGDIPAAVQARKSGALFYHGIKSPQALEAIVKCNS